MVEARTFRHEVHDGFVSVSAEAAERVVPETNLGLKEVEIVVTCDNSDKSPQLKPRKLVDKFGLHRAGFGVERAGVVCSLEGLPFALPVILGRLSYFCLD